MMMVWRKKRVVLIASGLVVSLLLVAYGLHKTRSRHADPIQAEVLAGLQSEMIQFGERKPQVFLQAYTFRGQIDIPISLDDECIVEFIPLMIEQAERPAKITTYFISPRKREHIRTYTAFPCRSAENQRSPFNVLAAKVQVDLTPWRGKHGTLRWVLHGLDSPQPLDQAAGLACLKVHRKNAPTNPKRPHILFICSDAHRYDYSIGGGGPELMPYLHRLMRNAVNYTHAYSNASWTLPSIVSTFTGVFPRFHRTGQRVRSGTLEELQAEPLPAGQFLWQRPPRCDVLSAYPKQLTTITEHLQRAGYNTTAVLANPLYILSGLHADGQDIVIDAGVTRGTVVNPHAFRMIDTTPPDTPLFLIVHYIDVHHFASFYFRKKYPGRSARQQPKEYIGCYEQAVRDTDRNMQALVERWESKFGKDESLIVFYADHGEHLLDPGRYIIGHGCSMDEALLHVPLVVKYPGVAGVPPGEVSTAVSLTDLFLTVLDLLGIDPGQKYPSSLPLTRFTPEPDQLQGREDRAGSAESAHVPSKRLLGWMLESPLAGAVLYFPPVVLILGAFLLLYPSIRKRKRPSRIVVLWICALFVVCCAAGTSLWIILRNTPAPPRLIFADYQSREDEMSSVRQGALKLILNLDQSSREMVNITLDQGTRGEKNQLVDDHPQESTLREAYLEYVRQSETAAVDSNEMVDQQEAYEILRALGYAK